jgi:hypothetical protein
MTAARLLMIKVTLIVTAASGWRGCGGDENVTRLGGPGRVREGDKAY